MQFNRIGRDAKQIIESYTKKWNIENADYSFTTLYLWGRHGKITYAIEDGALFLLYNFPHVEKFFAPPVPMDKNADYARLVYKALDTLKEMGVKKPSLRTVAPPFKQLIIDNCPDIMLKRTRNADDYVYSRESLASLKGKKLASKRNHINRFMQDNENWEYVPLKPDMLSECMGLYEEWQESKDEDLLEGLEENDERLTVELAIKHMDELGLIGGAIRIDGRVEAFTVAEKTAHNIAFVHIEKANAQINGLYPLINREFVRNELTDIELINREDDMGLEGLRKAKLSYAPLTMVEKYKAFRA